MNQLVLREDADGIATLTLNRPDKRNALNLALWGELDAHVEAIAAAGERIGARLIVLGEKRTPVRAGTS